MWRTGRRRSIAIDGVEPREDTRVTDDHAGHERPVTQRPAGVAELAVALGYSYLSEAECVTELHRVGGIAELEEALRRLPALAAADPHGVGEARRLLEAALPARPDHVVAFYDDEPFLARTVARFLQAGFERGERCVVIATAEHREGFEEALRAGRVPVAQLRRAGRYVEFDAVDTLVRLAPAGELDGAYFDREVGGILGRQLRDGVRVRAYGEMVALLWGRGYLTTALELEDRWNGIQASTPFPLLCGYPLGAFADEGSAADFHAICERHTGVTTESYSTLRGAEGEDVVVLDRGEPGGRPSERPRV
jgi:hypothetical protein